MKRWLIATLAVLLGLAVLTSCADRHYVEFDALGESFRAENAEMFLNPACDHYLRYRELEAGSEIDGSFYHIVYCHWGHCGYETHEEPHVIELSQISSATGMSFKENGYFYHRVLAYCVFCDATLEWWVLCEDQEDPCSIVMGENCLADADWRELLCDTPYEILGD